MYIKPTTYLLWFLLLICCVGLIVYLFTSRDSILPLITGLFQEQQTSSVLTKGEQDTNQKVTIKGPVLNESQPTRIRIPSVAVETAFTEPLDLDAERVIQVPNSYTEVGWYKHSPTPGELGPSVVLGHVDSKDGPGVFYSLGQVDVGDEIFITRADGNEVMFVVTALERPLQNAFPTEKVYGNIDHAGLRLITCSGIYLKGVKRYTNNLIVYAALVEK
jgi:sortase (surface protein transpeptidase)